MKRKLLSSGSNISFMDTFGSRLRRIRRKNKLTQKELGRLVGVSGPMVTQWEADASLPKTDNAERLCSVLGTTWEHLKTGVDPSLSVQERPEKYLPAFTNKARVIDKAQIGKAIEFGVAAIDDVSPPDTKLNAVLNRISDEAAFAFVESSEGMSPLIRVGDLVAINPNKRECKAGLDVWLFAVGDNYVLGRVKETVRGLMLNFANKEPGWEPMPIAADKCYGKVVALMPGWLLWQ